MHIYHSHPPSPVVYSQLVCPARKRGASGLGGRRPGEMLSPKKQIIVYLARIAEEMRYAICEIIEPAATSANLQSQVSHRRCIFTRLVRPVFAVRVLRACL